MEEKFDITSHKFVPVHTKITEEGKAELLSTLKITIYKLPKILSTDPAIVALDPKADEIIKIERDSPTIGKTQFYRRVIDG